jgi:hypothetical protein
VVKTWSIIQIRKRHPLKYKGWRNIFASLLHTRIFFYPFFQAIFVIFLISIITFIGKIIRSGKKEWSICGQKGAG